MSSMWYDKQGNSLESHEAIEKLLTDPTYKIIAKTVLPNEKVVSTVWLGLDHNFYGGTPLIFETMVFPKEGDFCDEYCERYATLAEAKNGHEEVVKKFS